MDSSFDHTEDIWEPAFESVEQTVDRVEDAINLIASHKRKFFGVSVHIEGSKAIVLLQLSRGKVHCGLKEGFDICHTALIVQKIVVETPLKGLGTSVCKQLAKLAATKLNRCFMLQSPISEGGRALAKKLGTVNVALGGAHMLCRDGI